MCGTDESINCDDYVDSIISTWKKLTTELISQRDISKILKGAGIRSARDHVYYLGKESAGILGFVDASEMPDTYGAAFTEFRGFCTGGWVGPVLLRVTSQTAVSLSHLHPTVCR